MLAEVAHRLVAPNSCCRWPLMHHRKLSGSNSSSRSNVACSGTSPSSLVHPPHAVRRPHAPAPAPAPAPALAHVASSSSSSSSRHRCTSCMHVVDPPFGWRSMHTSRALSARHASSSHIRGSSQETITVPVELSSEQKVQLLAAITGTSSYVELHSLVKKCGAELDENIAVYALLQAANLQETLKEEPLRAALQDPDAFQHIIQAQNEVVEMLVPCIERCIRGYPASIQLSVTSALAQLDTYSESIFSAVAHSCCQLGDATGGMAQAAEQAQAEARASATGVILEPSSPSSPSTSAPLLPNHTELSNQMAVVGIQLMLSSSAYALMGHYDRQLFDLIATQVVKYLDNIADTPTLVNILCAFMDVDHFHRELLEQAGGKLAAEMSDLDPSDAVSVLLVYAFFRVKNPEFYTQLLALASTLDTDSLDAKTAGMLYRGIKLLPDPVSIPAPVIELLQQSLKEFGMLELSASSSITDQRMLDYFEQVEGEENEKLLLGLGMPEVIARRQLFALLTEGLGLPAARHIPATQDGWLPMHIAVQFEGANICFLLVKDGMAQIRNEDMKLRGPIASEIRCLRQEGWIVLPMEVQDWNRHMLGCSMETEGDVMSVDIPSLASFIEDSMRAAVADDLEMDDDDVN